MTLYTDGYSTLTFNAKGYSNFGKNKFVLSLLGCNSFDDTAGVGWYGNPCADATNFYDITDILNTEYTEYSIDVSAWDYVYFKAYNKNDAGAGVELRHITLK